MKRAILSLAALLAFALPSLAGGPRTVIVYPRLPRIQNPYCLAAAYQVQQIRLQQLAAWQQQIGYQALVSQQLQSQQFAAIQQGWPYQQ
jgi:hypothetical protein